MTAGEERRRWIARVARRFGVSMREVRSMTLKDVVAMDAVIREEELRARQMAQARKARGRR